MAPKAESRGHVNINTASKVLAAGAVVGGVLYGINFLEGHGFHFDIFDNGAGPATGHASVIPGTTTEKVVELECDGRVTEAVGSTAVSHYSLLGLSVGGYYTSRAYPVTIAECAPGGLQAAEQVTSVNGKVTEVKVPTFTYSPYFEGIDELNPLICIHEGITSSASALKKAENDYKSEDGCDSQGQTTGLGTNAHGASETEELARRDSVIAASLTPVPGDTEKKFEADLVDSLEHQAATEYPHAKIYVEAPQTESDATETLAGWESIKSEAMKDFSTIKFSVHNGNQIEMAASSTDASGNIYVTENLTKPALRRLVIDLNKSMEKPKPKAKTKHVKTSTKTTNQS